jgi:mercuric ion transport protein
MQSSSTKQERRTMTINDAAPTTDAPETLRTTSRAAPKWLAALGLLGGFGAVAASSCCVLPLGLAALGAGAGVLGGVEYLTGWRTPLLALSALAVAGGWAAWRRKGPVVCASGSSCATLRRSRGTLALLLVASVVVTVAASWDYIEPALLKMTRGR